MNKFTVVSAVITLGILLSGCAQAGPTATPSSVLPTPAIKSITPEDVSDPVPTATSPETTPKQRSSVEWQHYAPDTQASIDSFTSSQDCQGIQSYFGMATATEESVKSQYGHDSSALVAYLNEALALAGC